MVLTADTVISITKILRYIPTKLVEWLGGVFLISIIIANKLNERVTHYSGSSAAWVRVSSLHGCVYGVS